MTARRAQRPGSRRTARATGLLTMVLVAASCGGGSESDTGAATEDTPCGPDQEVALTFTWWGSDARHEYTQELIDRFEEANPNVTVQGSFTGWGDYWDRLATSVAGGDTPDVMQQESRYVREYAERGALLDLSEYIPGTIDDAQLDQNVLPSGQIDGATYAIPTGVNALAVVADPQAFADAGVPLPDDDSWTWEDFQEAATAVSAATPDGIWGVQDKGYNDANLEIFARQRGESLYTEDGQLGISPQTLADWWQISLDLVESGGEPSASVSVETNAAGLDQSLLATGRGAMQFNWTNELPSLTSSSGRDLQLLRFPGESTNEQAGIFFKPAMFWSAGADTECPEVAASFIDFLINDPAAAELILSDRGLPVNTELREQILADLPPADQQSADFLQEIELDLAEPPPLPPQGAGELADILSRYNEQVLFGQLPVDEAVEQFMAEAGSAIG